MYTNIDGVATSRITWTAPTHNTDGSLITDQLTYNLYIDGTQSMSFPGVLNPDGRYSFDLANVAGIEQPGSYVFELTAVDESGDESDKSGALTIIRTETVPNAPAGLEAG